MRNLATLVQGIYRRVHLRLELDSCAVAWLADGREPSASLFRCCHPLLPDVQCVHIM